MIEQNPSIDLSAVDRIVAEIGRGREALIPLLQALQAEYRYLPEEALRRLAEITEITPSDIVGVATFYNQFRLQPAGRHLISVCHGTACHVKGAGLVHDALCRHLQLPGEEGTDADGLFTVQKVACLGCCTLAPVLQIDGVTYGHLTPETVPNVVRDFLELVKRGLIAQRKDDAAPGHDGLAEIRIGTGSCCAAGGSLEVQAALEGAVR
ncbi:MAG TPA: NAD(P)H-dependent oxidoreductase subunit E, partial [Armatimonadota bacterium]